jgi:hypothetical protein
MSKKYIKEVEEQSFEDKLKSLDDKLNNLNVKSKEINNQIVNSKAQASAASTQASRAVGVNPAVEVQDKKMKTAQAAKSRAELGYYQNELKKVKDEIEMTNLEKTNLQKNKKTQTEQKMAKLTKEQILNMVKSEESSIITKQELVESIYNKILTEDMDDDLRRKIESGEHDYSEHINPETVKRMARELVDSAKANLEAKGGRGSANFAGAQALLMQGLSGALQKEVRHKGELEQLAVKLVSEEYGVPEDAVDFDVKITGHPQMGGEEIRKTGLKMKKGVKTPPQGKSTEELKPNVTKRRLMNAMMHGAARKGQNLFHMASEELNNINPSLVQDYSKLMAGNDFMYWALSDDTIARESESGTHAGQVKVDLSGPKPKIIARGMTFPFLLHELTKGVLELISLHGLDVDKEVRDYVLDKTDNLESEPMDIRLGVKIWDKFLEVMDVDALPYKSQIFTELSTLPPDEFNSLINGILEDDQSSIQKVKDIIFDVIREVNQEDVENIMSQYDEPSETGSEEGGNEEVGTEEVGAEEIDDPRNWSKRDLENARDEALDNEDYRMVALYQTILDEKFY